MSDRVDQIERNKREEDRVFSFHLMPCPNLGNAALYVRAEAGLIMNAASSTGTLIFFCFCFQSSPDFFLLIMSSPFSCVGRVLFSWWIESLMASRESWEDNVFRMDGHQACATPSNAAKQINNIWMLGFLRWTIVTSNPSERTERESFVCVDDHVSCVYAWDAEKKRLERLWSMLNGILYLFFWLSRTIATGGKPRLRNQWRCDCIPVFKWRNVELDRAAPFREVRTSRPCTCHSLYFLFRTQRVLTSLLCHDRDCTAMMTLTIRGGTPLWHWFESNEEKNKMMIEQDEEGRVSCLFSFAFTDKLLVTSVKL